MSFEQLRLNIEHRKDWNHKKLKYSLKSNDGGVWGDEYDDDGTIILRSTEIRIDGTWSILDPARRSLSPADLNTEKLISGDLLITKSSGSEEHLGKTALVNSRVESLSALYSNFMQRLRLAEPNSPRYFYYFLNSYVGREYLGCTGSTTTGLRNLSAGLLNDLLTSSPPEKEQKQIAAFLDHETAKIDALIEKQQQLIALLAEKRQAVISHAVTKGLNPDAPMRDSGVEWLGDVPAHWDVPRLGQIARVFNGSTPSRDKKRYWKDEGIPWLSSGKVNEDLVTKPSEWISRAALSECSIEFAPSGSIIIGMIGQGATRGMCALLGIQTTINQNMASLVPGGHIDSNYLYNFITAAYDDLRLLGRGANQPALNCEILRSYKIAVPPLSEQVEISERINSFTTVADQVSAFAQEQMTLLQERRTALISAAVTGKIDVRDWSPPADSVLADTA